MYSLNNTNSVKFKFVVPTPLKGSQTVADGTYIIASALNKKLVLDIPHSSIEYKISRIKSYIDLNVKKYLNS